MERNKVCQELKLYLYYLYICFYFQFPQKDVIDLIMAVIVTYHALSTVKRENVTFSLKPVLGVNLDEQEHIAT